MAISEHQRKEFGELIEAIVGQIESGEFLRRNGIRFREAN